MTLIHLQDYLNERSDQNEALFVSLANPHERLQISGVEVRLRKIGREANIPRVHPHKFRRTLATMAMPKSPDYSDFIKNGMEPKPVESNRWYRAKSALSSIHSMRLNREETLWLIEGLKKEL